MRFTLLIIFCLCVLSVSGFRRREDKTKCPHVKSIRNFDLNEVSFLVNDIL